MHPSTILLLSTAALASAYGRASSTAPKPTTTTPAATAKTTPYPTSFPAMPTGNAEYAAMTASQHAAYCATADPKNAWYSQACIDKVWAGLYGRSPSTFATVAVPTAAVEDVYVDVTPEEEQSSRSDADEVYDSMDDLLAAIERLDASSDEVYNANHKRNIGKLLTQFRNLFQSKPATAVAKRGAVFADGLSTGQLGKLAACLADVKKNNKGSKGQNDCLSSVGLKITETLPGGSIVVAASSAPHKRAQASKPKFTAMSEQIEKLNTCGNAVPTGKDTVHDHVQKCFDKVLGTGVM